LPLSLRTKFNITIQVFFLIKLKVFSPTFSKLYPFCLMSLLCFSFLFSFSISSLCSLTISYHFFFYSFSLSLTFLLFFWSLLAIPHYFYFFYPSFLLLSLFFIFFITISPLFFSLLFSRGWRLGVIYRGLGTF